MYGTVARLQVKPGKEADLIAFGDQVGVTTIPGLVRELIYRMDVDATEFYMCVAFESKEAYFANANSPEQHARYEQFRALLAADPEWHDGEIVFAHP
ncbi:MAG: antibiotic biosynthesis monooxygenase [Chloroflexi bacterium]|nr:antibiotic biosynthesis monooxygenase [Chloroflexota bacterium]